jgi:hypothetical protein
MYSNERATTLSAISLVDGAADLAGGVVSKFQLKL